MTKVLHIITGLGQGGAERQLSNLVSECAFESAIFSIMKPGVMANEIHASNVRIYSGDARNVASLGWLIKLRKSIKSFNPDLIMGWMYHGNIASFISSFMGFSGPVIWNIRHSLHDLQKERTSTRLAIRAGSYITRSPSRIIYNSAAAADQHEALGFHSGKRAILANGFDLERFKPDALARKDFREKLDISPDKLLLGVVGRSHPMKNHHGWLQAFRQTIDVNKNMHCIMAGTGVAGPDSLLSKTVKELSLEEHVTLLPQTPNPEKLYPALDLLVMPSSWGEGFPNVVGEAMACGVPALVTNIGDASVIVGDTGFVAGDSTPETLAQQVLSVSLIGQAKLAVMGQRARERMVRNYGLSIAADAYEKVIEEVMIEIKNIRT